MSCRACGACCASLRVTLGEDELESRGGSVPDGMTEPYANGTHLMRGTGTPPARCVALRGDPGREVGCAIYEWRPAACRDFAPYAQLGRGDAACAEARRRHGMAALP